MRLFFFFLISVTFSGFSQNEKSAENLDKTEVTRIERLLINPSETKESIGNSLLTIKNSSTSKGKSATHYTEVYRKDTISCSQNTIGGVFKSSHSASVYNEGTTGASFIGVYDGSGHGNYVYGAITSAKYEGKGNIEFIIPDSQRALIAGNQKGTVNYIRSNSSNVTINNPNILVNYAQGMHPTVNFENGTVKNGQVIYLDVDYLPTGNANITGDFAYIQSGNDKLPPSKGNYHFIKSETQLPSSFAGIIETNVPVQKIQNASKKVLVSKEWVLHNFQTPVTKLKQNDFLNNWENTGTFEQVGYYKIGHTVHFQGIASKGKKNTVIFNLPKKYIPKSKLIRLAFDTEKNIKIQINTNGEVAVLDTYKDWVNLSTISFRVDN